MASKYRENHGKKNRMPRISAFLLAAAVLLASVGCGSDGAVSTADQNAAEQAAAGQTAAVQESAAQETEADGGAERTEADGSAERTEVSGGSETEEPVEVVDPGTTYWFTGKTAEEIVAELSLDEKVWQMIQIGCFNVTPEQMQERDYGSVLSKWDGYFIDSAQWKEKVLEYQEAALASDTGLPYIYGQDDVHGVNYCRGAVIYPHNIGLGAANDPELMYRIGAATADEAKMAGMLWNFAPCVAVSKDPRWGRTYESYSSQEEIVKTLGSAYVEGFRDNGAAACGKHFFADGSETWGTGQGHFLIDRGDAWLTDEEADRLLDVYKGLVDAGVPSIMLSYGRVNGVRMHENAHYISVLRQELGFEGMIVSDWEGVCTVSGDDFSEQLVNAINAGVDMLMEPNDYDEVHRIVVEEVEEGNIPMERIDDAVRRIVQFKISAGVMDDPLQENMTTRQEQCGCEEYRKLAEEAVEKSMVLLKNEDSVLPLRDGMKVFVTGPAADSIYAQCGGWTESWQGAEQTVEGATSILEGLRERAREHNITIITDPAQAESADVTLLFVGEHPYAEWFGDDEDIDLTGDKSLEGNEEAIRRARDLREQKGIPTVACIVAGRQVILDKYPGNWDAAVMCYLPGSEGTGVANVLMGDAAFTGKLPMPWYNSTDEIGTDRCLYPVGYGLTY